MYLARMLADVEAIPDDTFGEESENMNLDENNEDEHGEEERPRVVVYCIG